MKRFSTLVLAVVTINLLSGCSLIKGIKTIHKANITQKEYSYTIPFDNYSNHIIVQTGINGCTKKYSFCFDSGAGVTVISKKIADSLGLKKVGEIPVTDTHGAKNINNVVVIPELDINGLKIYNVGAVVSDYPANSFINCIARDGIIGVNVISKCNWTVDFENNTVTATDGALKFPAQTDTIPFYDNIPHINFKVNGKLVKGVFVDLGSNESIELQRSLFAKHPDLIPDKSFFTQFGYSSQGFNGTKFDTLLFSSHNTFQINNLLISDQLTSLMESPMCRIGNDFWDKYLLGLDYKKHKLLLSRNHKNLLDNKMKGIGCSFAITDSGCYISSIFKNSAATENGLNINDKVLEIDGMPVAKKFNSNCDLYAWMRTDLKNLSELKLKIQGRQDVVVLKSAPYKPVGR